MTNEQSAVAAPAPEHSAPRIARISLPLYRTGQFVVRTYLTLWHQLRVEGLEHIPRTGSLIVAANHMSHLDPALLGSVCPRAIHYLAKEELFHQPFLRWFLTRIGQVPVARDAGSAGMALKNGVKLLQEGQVMGVFPEGTRSKTGQRQKARTGVVVLASLGHAPILPAYIYGTFAAFPPKTKLPIPFKPVGIRFGEPFRLSPEECNLEDRAGMEQAAEKVLDHVFALAPS